MWTAARSLYRVLRDREYRDWGVRGRLLNVVELEAASRQQHSDERQDGEDNGAGFGKEGN